jgi:hypothetical protein
MTPAEIALERVGLRTTRYTSRASWAADARRGAPDFHMGGTSGFKALRQPWTCWNEAQSWNADDAYQRELDTATDDGVWWEPDLFRYAAERHGFNVLSAGGDSEPFRVHHPERRWLDVSPDCLAWNEAWGGLGVLDAKTSYQRDLWADDGEVLEFGARMLTQVEQPKYVTQLALLMAATGAAWGGFVVGLSFRDVRLLRVKANPKVTDGIVQRVADWRERHLIGGVQPEYDASEEAVNYVAARLAEIRRDAEPHEVELAHAYREAHAAEKAAAKRRKGLKATIVKAMADGGGHRRLILSDGGRVSLDKRGGLRVTPAKGDEG